MFPVWRLRLREARHAVSTGRWEEAAAMLASPELREFLPAKELSRSLADRLMVRAADRLAQGNSAAGWCDLEQAAQLGADEQAIDQFRQNQAATRMAEVVRLLSCGESQSAVALLDRVDRRPLGADGRTWRLVAAAMDHGEVRASRGDLPAAIQSLARACRLLPEKGSQAVADYLQTRIDRLQGLQARQTELDARLHAAVAKPDWAEALAAADALLELAPQHAAARQARQKAWEAVGMEATRAFSPVKGRLKIGPAWIRNNPRRSTDSTCARGDGQGDTVTNKAPSGKRLIAWIDAVGAFLVCLGDEIVLGQGSVDGAVDVPILGDVSRRHAVIRREGESYVLTPLGRTAVDGRAISESVILRDRAAIRLGENVELRFRKPHALSGSAALEFVSHHKSDPAVDGVVLMSESCILGPQLHSHIRCRNWTGDLVLFRRGSDLMCRAQAPLAVDGETGVLMAAVRPGVRVESDEFALSFEEV